MRGADGGDADAWDVVLDEEFVKGGRAEATAQERAEHAARIHREHQTATSWRADRARPEPPPSGSMSKSVGLKALAVVTVAVLRRRLGDPGLPRTGAGGGTDQRDRRRGVRPA